MKLLLDTHIFLKYISAEGSLKSEIKEAIRDADNEVYLSAASVWESIIKYQLGKLPLPGAPADFIPEQREAHDISPLAIDEQTMKHLASLPSLHRDPFDRIIIAQAIQHDLTLVTMDDVVRKYALPLLPATD